MFRHDNASLVYQTEPFFLHSRRHHFKGFTSADAVGKQSIAAEFRPHYGVQLMRFQPYGRRHSGERLMRAVKFSADYAVEQIVVALNIFLAALRLLPQPALKGFFHFQSLILRQISLLFVYFIMLLSVNIGYLVLDDDIPIVEQIFKDRLCRHSGCAVNLRCSSRSIPILVFDFVLACYGTAQRFKEASLCVLRKEFLIVLNIYP